MPSGVSNPASVSASVASVSVRWRRSKTSQARLIAVHASRLSATRTARALLRELRPGDLLVLPLHEVAARDDVVRKAGLTKEQAFEAVKVAATVQGVAQAIFAAETLATASV